MEACSRGATCDLPFYYLSLFHSFSDKVASRVYLHASMIVLYGITRAKQRTDQEGRLTG